MSSENVNETIRFEPEDSCPPLTAIVTGIQLAVILIALVIVPIVIIARTAEQPEEYLTWAVFASLIICGGSTILNALRIGRIGTGHILVVGTAEPAIAISITALTEGGPAMLASVVMISALVKFVVAARLSLLRRIITPTVSGIVLMLISATVIFGVFGILTSAPEGVSTLAAPVASSVTFGLIAILLLRSPRPLQLWAPILGILAGCIVAIPFGLYDFAPVVRAGWIGLPQFDSWPGFQFAPTVKFWALLPAFIIVNIIVSFKTIADSIAIQRISQRQPRASDFRLVQGALYVDGISNFLSGVAGTVPNMTASPGAAVVNLTGVAARTAGIYAGIFFILLAILPKLTSILLAIPSPVAAAYIIIIMGLVFVEGLKTISEDNLDSRKAVVVGVAFWIGLGFQNQAIFGHLISGTFDSVLSNSVTTGSIVAALMIAFVELTSERRIKVDVDLDMASLPEIDRFLVDYANRIGWDEASKERMRLVGEETLAIMLQYEEEDVQRRLIVSARRDDNIVELEFLSGSDRENLEDRLTYLAEQPETVDEREISFRLLRHYASSVHHQKYHEVDVITVDVEGSRKPA